MKNELHPTTICSDVIYTPIYVMVILREWSLTIGGRAGKFWGRVVFFGRPFGVGHNFMGPRLGEGYNFWAPFIKTLGDVQMGFVLLTLVW